MALARELVRAVRAAADPPPHVARLATLHLLDALGVGLAATTLAAGRVYREAARRLGSPGVATVLGARGGTSPALAALVNGGLIHALEYDDTHTGSIVHGSSVLAPSALAAAETVGASGAKLLRTFALGWEVLVRIGLAAPGGFQREGFQVTSVAGALVAALVAAEIDGLSEDGTVAAIGIALSQGSGVFEFLTNGSTVKSLHPGWAAHAGLCAAAFAAAGLTGPETSLEGRRGLFARFAGDEAAPARFQAALGDLGSIWHLERAAFKFVPCCHYIHPFLEALDAVERRGHELADVEALTCFVPPEEAPIICDPWDRRLSPTSAHEMRYSLPVVLALRAVEGRVELSSFERPPSPAVLAYAGRIAAAPLLLNRFPDRFEAAIRARLRTGDEFRIEIDDVFGGASRPASEEAVRAKFRANARLAGDGAAVDHLEQAILSLAEGAVSDLSEAIQTLEAGRR